MWLIFTHPIYTQGHIHRQSENHVQGENAPQVSILLARSLLITVPRAFPQFRPDHSPKQLKLLTQQVIQENTTAVIMKPNSSLIFKTVFVLCADHIPITFFHLELLQHPHLHKVFRVSPLVVSQHSGTAVRLWPRNTKVHCQGWEWHLRSIEGRDELITGTKEAARPIKESLKKTG